MEALALRDSAPQSQGRVRVIQVDILMVVHRAMTPHPSRGKKVSLLMIVIANLLGGTMSRRPPPSLKTFIMHAMLAAKDKAGATMSHVGSHPAMP